LKSIWVFDKSISNYKKTDVLPAWQGAFVFSGQGGKIKFPVLAKTPKTEGKSILITPTFLIRECGICRWPWSTAASSL